MNSRAWPGIFGGFPAPPSVSQPPAESSGAGGGATGSVLRGPFILDYTQIPHQNDSIVLYAPQAGEHIIQLIITNNNAQTWGNGWFNLVWDGEIKVSNPYLSFGPLYVMYDLDITGDGTHELIAVAGGTPTEVAGHYEMYLLVVRPG